MLKSIHRNTLFVLMSNNHYKIIKIVQFQSQHFGTIRLHALWTQLSRLYGFVSDSFHGMKHK